MRSGLIGEKVGPYFWKGTTLTVELINKIISKIWITEI